MSGEVSSVRTGYFETPRCRALSSSTAGNQLTSLSHVEDVASMMALAAGNPNAIKQHYNAASGRAITLEGIAFTIGDAMGKSVTVDIYPAHAEEDVPKSAGKFPFRKTHFFVSTLKAKEDLGWEPKHNFLDDMKVQVRAQCQIVPEEAWCKPSCVHAMMQLAHTWLSRDTCASAKDICGSATSVQSSVDNADRRVHGLWQSRQRR